jgi:hypothetical protein
LGDIAHLEQDYESMVAYFQETLDLRQSLGHERWVDNILYWLGLGLAEMGDTQGSAQVLAKRLARLQARGRSISILDDLIGWAGIVLSTGDAERAAVMLGAFQALHPRHFNWRDANEDAVFDRALAKIQAQLTPVAFSAAWEQGTGMNAEQAIQEVFRAAHRFAASA